KNGTFLHPHTKPPVRCAFPAELLPADHPYRGKTRLAKWYAPYDDEEKIKLKGEVRRLRSPPSHVLTRILTQTRHYRCTASSPRAIRNTNPISSSSATTKSCTDATRVCSSACASTRTTTSWRTWRRSTSLSRF